MVAVVYDLRWAEADSIFSSTVWASRVWADHVRRHFYKTHVRASRHSAAGLPSVVSRRTRCVADDHLFGTVARSHYHWANRLVIEPRGRDTIPWDSDGDRRRARTRADADGVHRPASHGNSHRR